MNITLSIFCSEFGNRASLGAHFINPNTKANVFYGLVDSTEEKCVNELLIRLDNDFEELGSIQFITTTTKYFNFLSKSKEGGDAIKSEGIVATLSKLNKLKGTKFKKNVSPGVTDIIGLSRADMMNTHIQRANTLDGATNLTYTDTANLTEMKRSYKRTPNIFLGSKLFNWGDTETITLKGKDLSVYYNGGFTAKTGKSKSNNTLAEFDKLLRQRLYTYYTGSNAKLTDAGQRSLDEIRCVTLLADKHPVVETFFEFQKEGLTHIPFTPVYVANLDKVVSSASSNRFMTGDKHWFTFSPESGDMTFNGITRSDVSHVFYPQRLGPRIRNQFLSLKDKFINHLQGTRIGEEYDITDLLYEAGVNKKGVAITTPKDVLNGKFNFIKIPKMSFDGANFTLKYVFDIDCPPARVMKSLTPYNPKVSIVFENLSDTTIGYYTIVRTDIGVSIYSCPEGSKLVRRKR